ncbi:MAG TPA: prepilin peptidase [Gaiellaceae bacterium]|jgi:leader peptidase (prepilin peptidase) / N-methyltransferase|nr:prepilin peptidase [Gaiellaceae bacterium]
MDAAALAFVMFAPALALGSFLNVVAARLPEGRSLVKPRSACGSCEASIAWYDNVPLVSYLVLHGRCRSCGASFSLRYPAVELATAGLVAACFWHFGFTGEAVVGAYFCAVLVVLSAIDAERRILPDLIVLPSFVLVLGANIALHPDRWVEYLGSALGASLFLFLALVAYPRGMGMGDVKLALLLGAGLGKVVGVGLMLGMVAALFASTVLFTRHGLAARKMAIPFGPFLAFGAIVALFVGQPLLDAYLSRF